MIYISEGLEAELNARFSERDISEQLVLSSPALAIINRVTVRWKRKRIEAYVEEGKVNKIQSMVCEHRSARFTYNSVIFESYLGI